MEEKDQEKLICELKESDDRYRFITETSIDAILTSDTNDLILTWNKGAELIFGYGSDIIGMPVTTIIPERYRKAHMEGVKRFVKTGERHIIGKKVELEAVRKDGIEFPVELSLSSWQSSSGVFFGAIIRDIAERKQTERMREDVQRMMRHDLKSPLIGMTGLAKTLQKGSNLSRKQQKAAALIQELGMKMLEFIDRSRDLFHMEQGIYRLTPRRVNLLPILKGIQGALMPLASKRQVDFMLTLEGHSSETESEYFIEGEETLLEVMFANLLKNAVEASPDGGSVTITIRMGDKDGRPFHLIDIHNLGAVPQAIRDRFFQPYVTSGKEGGTGLGAHSALLVARTHQGDIVFTTSEDGGTHVIVKLPKTLAPDPEV
ncbi:MAG: PAS domain-containing sensor histidine kinase [Pseudomonadota bacterium]